MPKIWSKVRAVGGGDRWHPGRLFRPGDAGGFWDFRHPYVFEDAAGTIPATVGGPIGLVLDRSGLGNHASRSTTSAKPLLGLRNGRPCAVPDGVDDYLVVPDFFTTYGDDREYTVVIAQYLDPLPDDWNRRFVLSGSGYGLHLLRRNNARLSVAHFYNDNDLWSPSSPPEPEVVSAEYRRPGSSAWRNGTLVGDDPGRPATPDTLGVHLHLLALYNGVSSFATNPFAIFFLYGRRLSDPERRRVEKWMARRAGVTLGP